MLNPIASKRQARELAAVVASKVFFHLEEYDDALRLGLGAGQYFNVAHKSEYVDTLVSKALDEYIRVRHEQQEGGGEGAPAMDTRLEAIVERMFERCFDDGAFNQAVGVALEAHRLDKVKGGMLIDWLSLSIGWFVQVIFHARICPRKPNTHSKHPPPPPPAHRSRRRSRARGARAP